MDATPIELFTAAVGTITAAGVLFLACDLRALNRKFDRLDGRVSAVVEPLHQNVAIGLIGDPVPRVGSGAAVNRNA